MDHKHIIADMRHNLQKVSQIIHLIENYDNSNAGVELELLQKNITLLFESYVRLKMSYEKQEVLSPPPMPREVKNESKMETVTPPPAGVEPKEEKPAKNGFGFNFNLGDDEGKISQKMESRPEAKAKEQSEFNLEKAIDEASKISFNQPMEHHTEKEKTSEKSEDADKDQSVNARFTSLKKDVNLAEKHLNNPITDLSKEISLNKKFAFVNELFMGNMDAYNSAIQQLNTIGSLNYAHKYINELRATLKWERDNARMSEFIDLIERRWEK